MRNFFANLVAARQASANREIARVLQRSEFPNESYDHVLHMVEQGTIHERLNGAKI